MQELPTGTVTFLFTDIEGSTRLLAELGDRYADTLAEQLLDDDERRLFARLAAFAGSFDLEAAEAVCDADLDALAALVDKSLLRQTDEGRFFMLETIREFGSEQLVQQAESEEIALRHARYFAELAEAREPDLRTQDLPAALTAFENEQSNLR